jgi:hypothetical protein
MPLRLAPVDQNRDHFVVVFRDLLNRDVVVRRAHETAEQRFRKRLNLAISGGGSVAIVRP